MALATLLATVAPAENDTAGQRITAVEVGYHGVLQVGRWTPVRVSVAAGSSANVTVSVIASDPDGRGVEYRLQQVAGDQFQGVIQVGRLDAPVRVQATLESRGEDMEERILTVGGEGGLRIFPQSTNLWMVCGTHRGFELAAQLRNQDQAQAAGAVRPPPVEFISLTSSELPDWSTAFDGVRVLVLAGEGGSPAQAAAIKQWVQLGGRLVVLGGADPEALRTSPLAAWLPVAIGPTFRERQTTALTGQLTAFVPDKGALRSLDDLEVVTLALRDGVALIPGPTTPIVTRSAFGLGTVTVVGIDLNRAPFLQQGGAAEGGAKEAVRFWPGLPHLCLRLAGEKLDSVEAGSPDRQLQLSPTGVSDLQSQLAGALDDFPDVDRPSSWNVIGLLVVYLLVVGPVDYLLVHRVLRRPQLTWVTLPMWVLLASWWSTSFATAANGTAEHYRQFEVLDLATDTGVQRLRAWFSLYSPQTQRQSVAFHSQPTGQEQASVGTTRLSWLGRPEEGFRGMYRRGGIQLGGAGYQIQLGDDSSEAIGAPVDQWSSLSFAAQADWFAEQSDRPLAECRQVRDSRGQLIRWEFTHRLPVALEDWFAVQNLQVTFPLASAPDRARLEPGVPCDLLRGCGQQLLRAYIQGELTSTVKVKTGSETYIRADAYDPLSRDMRRLFRTLSFHDAAGGPTFTRLNNETLTRLDFSEFVLLDRLIVVGRLGRQVSEFDVDGQRVEPYEPGTYVRMIVPIVRETAPDE